MHAILLLILKCPRWIDPVNSLTNKKIKPNNQLRNMKLNMPMKTTMSLAAAMGSLVLAGGSANAANILSDSGFDLSGTNLGNFTKTITAHGAASTWLYGEFDNGTTTWDLSGGSALGNSPGGDDAAPLIQWVADGKTSLGVGTISFEIDWSDIDPDNSPNTADAPILLDLSLFVFGWNSGDTAPQTDSINSFITEADTFIPGGSVNLITDSTAAEGEFIIVQDNATSLTGLTKNNGFETMTVNVDFGLTGYDNVGVMFYGSFGGVTGQDSGYFDLDDVNLSVIPEPTTTALLGLGGLALILRRRK